MYGWSALCSSPRLFTIPTACFFLFIFIFIIQEHHSAVDCAGGFFFFLVGFSSYLKYDLSRLIGKIMVT